MKVFLISLFLLPFLFFGSCTILFVTLNALKIELPTPN
jgi:hypothetical protein